MTCILYLHGFLSSPSSKKAQQTGQWLRDHAPDIHYICPQLSSYPTQARQTLDALAESTPDLQGVIGSSLGGFWAAYLTEKLGIRSVLVNPAVAPHTRFQHMVGLPQQSYYGDEIYTLTSADLKVLKECDRPNLAKPSRYRVMLQAGDETLDYRMAEQRYQSSSLHVEPGGNHSFEGFERHLPSIFDFLTR